ncbi:two-partner secretion domain-containing protein, partial [Paraburkholderia sediminicola]
TYSSFNVSKAGADLNNAGINARTIVNQVTSTNPSLIQGAIGVLGPRANVILANPNGITVDGGSFVNAGHVVLSTGQVSFSDLAVAPGVTQRNVVLTTNGGTITIGAGGLSGTLVNLDLIAKRLAVNGPVTNDFTSSTGGIRAIIGDSTATYDTSFSPTDNGHDWLASSTSPGSTSSGLAVDITALGGLTAGRVELIVNDLGAGVRSLGSMYASAGDVVVSTHGDISSAQGSITAAHDLTISTSGAVSLQGEQALAGNNVTVSANGIALTADATGPSRLSAGNALSLTSASGIASRSSEIRANSTTSLTAQGDVRAGDSIVAGSDVAITTPGPVSLQDAQVLASNNLTVNANAITLTDDAAGPSQLMAGQALALTSAGDITSTGSTIQAGTITSATDAIGGDVTLTAGGNITNTSSPANLGIIFSANGSTSLTAQGDIINDNARILANNDVSFAAQGDVFNMINHTDGANGGQPLAYSDRGGSFLFFTHTSSGFSVDYGTVSQPDQLAWIASSGGSVTISGRNVTNSGGIIQSNDGAVTITAQDAFTNAAVFSGQANYSHGCWIVCHGSASSSVMPYGGMIQSGTDIAITAGTVARNIGGNVVAKGNISVTAPVTYAQGVTGYSAINQDRGFKAFFGSSWAQIIAADVGGGFAANGLVMLTGDAVIDGGYFTGGSGGHDVLATGHITTLRAPARTPVQIGQHLGLTAWGWY